MTAAPTSGRSSPGPPARPGPTPAVAAFDFDGTITTRDTLVPFLARVAGAQQFVSANGRLAMATVRGRIALRDRDRVKEHMLEMLLAHRSEDELRSLGERYAQELLARGRLREDVVARVQDHVAAGHRTVIVSASLVYYLEPIARELSIEDVICVEPEVVDGELTGRLAKPNVRGSEKAVRLREWLGAPPDGPLDVRLHAYGNSSGDHELLAASDVAWWLGRPARLPSGARVFTPDAPLG